MRGRLEYLTTIRNTPLETISEDAYLRLREGAEVIERDGHGEKVLSLPDGSYLKLFRRKRLISSAAWYPYAQRFADNAAALQKRGIPCPKVVALYRVQQIKRDIVVYRPLPGRTLREIVQAGAGDVVLRAHLDDFIFQLHEAGVYFRSLHLGNIVLTPDSRLGLIDIADLRTQNKPLRSGLRQRNLQHLNRHPGDKAWLDSTAALRSESGR